MKKLKTLVVAILCFVLVFAICACQDPAGSGGNTGNGGGTSSGTTRPPVTEIKDPEFDEQNLQIDEEKITHIDNLVSQKISDEDWETIAKISYDNVSFKETITVNGVLDTEQIFKYALVNGQQHQMIRRITQKQIETYFGVYENATYFTYKHIKNRNSGKTDGWIKTTDAINVYMLSNVNILNLKPYALAEMFTFDATAKGYVAQVNILTFLIKFENNKVVYIEQKFNDKVFKTYVCDFNTTAVSVPQEVKNCFK